MREILVKGRTLPETYHKSLRELTWIMEHDGFGADGFVECGMTMEVEEPMAEPRISKMFPGGWEDLEQYRQEICDGILDFEVDAGNWDYTYHMRFSKWLDEFIIPELKKNPNSRRAVVAVRDNAKDSASENPACLQSLHFQIRDGKLDLNAYFRSNDAVRASFMNAFALTELQQKVADRLGVGVGRYVHRASNYHCYPESIRTLVAYYACLLSNNFDLDKTCYYYDKSWELMMNEARDKIAEKVATLKKKEGVE